LNEEEQEKRCRRPVVRRNTETAPAVKVNNQCCEFTMPSTAPAVERDNDTKVVDCQIDCQDSAMMSEDRGVQNLIEEKEPQAV